MGVVGMRFLLCGAVALARFVVWAMSSVLCLSGVPPRTETGTGSEPGNCRAGSEIQLGFHDGVAGARRHDEQPKRDPRHGFNSMCQRTI